MLIRRQGWSRRSTCQGSGENSVDVCKWKGCLAAPHTPQRRRKAQTSSRRKRCRSSRSQSRSTGTASSTTTPKSLQLQAFQSSHRRAGAAVFVLACALAGCLLLSFAAYQRYVWLKHCCVFAIQAPDTVHIVRSVGCRSDNSVG